MTIALNYELHRASERDPWLFLIHGLFGDLNNLSVIRRHFADQYNIVAIDLPDHGLSPHLPAFSLLDCAAGINAIIDKLGLSEVTLLGHSLGGKAAMMTALHYPQKVARLIVADIAPVTYPEHHQAIIAGLKAVQFDQVQRRGDIDKQLSEHIPEPGVRQFLLKSANQNEQGQWHWRFNLRGLADNYDAIRRWPDTDLQFSKSTLFIKGSESDYIQSAHREAIAALFPAARARIIEGAGHWLHAEKPGPFNQAVASFLDKTTSS